METINKTIDMKMSLTQYFELGGTLETLRETSTSIIDRYNQPPYEEHKVGRIAFIQPVDKNSYDETIYRIKYASGAIRERLAQGYIDVVVPIKLDLPIK